MTPKQLRLDAACARTNSGLAARGGHTEESDAWRAAAGHLGLAAAAIECATTRCCRVCRSCSERPVSPPSRRYGSPSPGLCWPCSDELTGAPAPKYVDWTMPVADRAGS